MGGLACRGYSKIVVDRCGTVGYIKRIATSPFGDRSVSRKGNIAKALEDQQGPLVNPKLVIMGSSTMDGRASTLLRIRPTLMKDISELCVGPMYLVIDLALQDLVARLKKEGKTLFVQAENLDPTAEDKALLVKHNLVPTPRKKAGL